MIADGTGPPPRMYASRERRDRQGATPPPVHPPADRLVGHDERPVAVPDERPQDATPRRPQSLPSTRTISLGRAFDGVREQQTGRSIAESRGRSRREFHMAVSEPSRPGRG